MPNLNVLEFNIHFELVSSRYRCGKIMNIRLQPSLNSQKFCLIVKWGIKKIKVKVRAYQILLDNRVIFKSFFVYYSFVNPILGLFFIIIKRCNNKKRPFYLSFSFLNFYESGPFNSLRA